MCSENQNTWLKRSSCVQSSFCSEELNMGGQIENVCKFPPPLIHLHRVTMVARGTALEITFQKEQAQNLRHYFTVQTGERERHCSGQSSAREKQWGMHIKRCIIKLLYRSPLFSCATQEGQQFKKLLFFTRFCLFLTSWPVREKKEVFFLTPNGSHYSSSSPGGYDWRVL